MKNLNTIKFVKTLETGKCLSPLGLTQRELERELVLEVRKDIRKIYYSYRFDYIKEMLLFSNVDDLIEISADVADLVLNELYFSRDEKETLLFAHLHNEVRDLFLALYRARKLF